MKKDVLSITDLSREEIYELLESAADLKAKRKAEEPTEFLKNKSLGMIFEKSSTRTRVSFEVAMTDFGGHALYLNSRDIQIGRGETIEDTARTLSGYLHGIMARVMSHETVKKLAEYSAIPVINALSDREHPCQILGDFMTIMEYKRRFEGLKFAWVGDGNNVCNSALLGSAIMGMEFAVACPKGYEPKAEFLEKAKALGGKFSITDDPKTAAKDADIIYTDVCPMGDEAEQEKRLKDFGSFQVNTELLGRKTGCNSNALPSCRRAQAGRSYGRPKLRDLRRGRKPPSRAESSYPEIDEINFINFSSIFLLYD